nr:hypothetical protein CFP56_68332 [Quercus suber]
MLSVKPIKPEEGTATSIFPNSHIVDGGGSKIAFDGVTLCHQCQVGNKRCNHIGDVITILRLYIPFHQAVLSEADASYCIVRLEY